MYPIFDHYGDLLQRQLQLSSDLSVKQGIDKESRTEMQHYDMRQIDKYQILQQLHNLVTLSHLQINSLFLSAKEDKYSYAVKIDLIGDFFSVMNLFYKIHTAKLPISCKSFSLKSEKSKMLSIAMECIIPKVLRSMNVGNTAKFVAQKNYPDPFGWLNQLESLQHPSSVDAYSLDEISYLGYVKQLDLRMAILWTKSGEIYETQIDEVIGQGKWKVNKITATFLLVKNIKTNDTRRLMRS